MESALDCWIILDHRGRVVEFNPATERVFGYRRDQVMGQPPAGSSSPRRYAGRIGQAGPLPGSRRGTRAGQDLELPAVRADGSELPVELPITKVALPGLPVFTACLWDLTGREQPRAEQQAPGKRRQSERPQSLGSRPGVAHDFNSLPGVTLYYAAFVVQRAAGDPAASADAKQIRAPAEQGAV